MTMPPAQDAALLDLLSHSEIGIGEVAKASGFRSVQYLNAVFKRELGSTPAAWRQGHRGSDASSLEQAHWGNSPPWSPGVRS